MYFKSFPYTYYSLDNVTTVQVVTNITTRAVISDEVKNNLSLYDEYDIRDGETPELVADKFYSNPLLHWIVLQYNDITDPRFGWPLDANNLSRYVSSKYNSSVAVHHYEDTDGNYVNANVILLSSSAFGNISVGDAIVNNTNSGTGFVYAKASNSNVSITVTTGGFITGDQIKLSTNASINANVTSTVTLSGIAVTNYDYEDEQNEAKRRIKILKASYVDSVVNDFKKKLGE